MKHAGEHLPRVVFWLGVVSLSSDVSAEMIYSLLPLFLTQTLGAGAIFVGVVEGAAEAISSFLKLVSGAWSDRLRRRKPLAVLGYGIASVARPLVGLATHPFTVLGIRVIDRFGKGLRTSPRDALLADATPVAMRGRAFGFQRAMDNAGAVIGGLIAAALLGWGHFDLRTVFLCAAIPAALAMVALVVGVKEPANVNANANANANANGEAGARVGPSEARDAGRTSDLGNDNSAFSRLNPYLLTVALFSLGNSADAFLLLRAVDLGVAAKWIPLLWMVHNAVKAALSRLGGALADRHGRRRLIIIGWIVYMFAYLGFGFARAAWQAWPLFGLYGLYYALVEGSERALVAELVSSEFRGRAYGRFHAVVGAAALPASLAFGWASMRFGASVPFTVAALLAGLAALLLARLVREPDLR